MKRTADKTDKHVRQNVLHARTVTGTGGGPEKTILNSPRFLEPNGYSTWCLFLRPPGDSGFEVLRRRASATNASLIEIDDIGKFSPRMVRSVIKSVREHNIHIWHAHDYKTNLLGIIVNRYHPMRLITTAHGWVNFDGMTPLYYWLDKRFFLTRYETVICVSETVREQAINGGTPQSKCVPLENAIDHEQFARRQPKSDAQKNLCGQQNDHLIIGTVGRLSEEKGFDLLIEAVSELIKEGMRIKLFIAGQGPEEKNLQTQIRKSGTEDHITLIGFCEDTQSFYESLDLFVLSSHREGLPNVVLEAMAVGTPVIATEVDGVPRVITHQHDGILIPPGSADAIKNAIQDAITSPQRCEALGEKAKQTICDKWSFKQRMEKIMSIYSNQ